MTPEEILKLIQSNDEKFIEQARKEVLRLYRDLDLDTLTDFLGKAIRTKANKGETLKKALGLFDDATRILKTTPAPVGQIIRAAVGDTVLTTDQLIAALSPEFQFNQKGRERQWAERNLKRFDKFWQKEPGRFRKDVYGAIKIGLRKNWSEERLAREIQERTGVSRFRAVRIARNEVINARAYANEQRQKDLGIEEYVWTTQRDRDVRHTHRLRDRKRYRWDAPGIKPGSEILCRCFGKPYISADRFRRSQ